MLKHGLALVLAAGVVSGCGGPVETRIVSSSRDTSAAASFALAAAPGTGDPMLVMAQQSVADALISRGWQPSNSAAHILSVSVAVRPAAISLTERDLASQRDVILADVKPTKPLQSCKDVEHRLVVTISRIADGDIIYKGSAAEYHCKAGLSDSISVLSAAALVGLGSGTSQTRIMSRTALE